MSAPGRDLLSDDEIMLLGLVCEGLANREIAAQVGSSEQAVT
jgi:DNA-binding NarL/FixJ family response regulator